MIVQLLAHTVVTGWGYMRDAGWVEHDTDHDTEFGPMGSEPTQWLDADYLAEFAGRLCYQSWDRPNPATATNEGYLTNIIGQQHFSVLEHASATFYVADISRACSHELVRHRHLSFSQVSQRYVDESKAVFVPNRAVSIAAMRDGINLAQLATDMRDAYVLIYERLVKEGATRKEARQAARWVLPNATETKLVVTGNMRAWRDVIAKRNSPHADVEIRELAYEILTRLQEIAPNTFRDM